MLESLLDNKKFLLVILVVVVVIVVVVSSGKSAEDTAIEFLEHLHEGEAKKMVSLLSEEMIDDLIDRGNYKTKKVLINSFEKTLEASIENFKDKYGKKWKYKIELVDSYEEDESCNVILEVTYSGKTLFDKIEESDTIEIELIKEGGKWKINSFPSL